MRLSPHSIHLKAYPYKPSFIPPAWMIWLCIILALCLLAGADWTGR